MELNEMTTAELCELLNASEGGEQAKIPVGGKVLLSSAGHRLQRTPEGFRPLSRGREAARRMRQRKSSSVPATVPGQEGG